MTSPSSPTVPPITEDGHGLHLETIAYMTALMNERDRRYAELRMADSKAIDAALSAAEKAVAAALVAAERAVNKAELAAKEQFNSVSAFTQSITDRTATLMPRSEAELRLSIIEKAVNSSAGKSQGAGALWGYVVGAFGVIVALITGMKS